MEFLSQNNLTGLAIGIATFVIIGVFHPIVIKAEYYCGTKCWWVFLILGISFIVLSILIKEILVSTIMSVLAFSCFWSILEVFQQKQRVQRGWFPKNPKRDADSD
ncbi:MAG: DUF4491 family protein [Tannerella sp.]|nr:DUF4491 family protein [Tannerella sp.]